MTEGLDGAWRLVESGLVSLFHRASGRGVSQHAPTRFLAFATLLSTVFHDLIVSGVFLARIPTSFTGVRACSAGEIRERPLTSDNARRGCAQ